MAFFPQPSTSSPASSYGSAADQVTEPGNTSIPSPPNTPDTKDAVQSIPDTLEVPPPPVRC